VTLLLVRRRTTMLSHRDTTVTGVVRMPSEERAVSGLDARNPGEDFSLVGVSAFRHNRWFNLSHGEAYSLRVSCRLAKPN